MPLVRFMNDLRRNALSRGSVLAILSFLMLGRVLPPTPARADERAQRQPTSRPVILDKIEDLEIRHRTEHYAIAATDSVEQKRLEEYGRALEYIYKEYKKGFSKLLAAEKKPGRGPSRNKPPVDDDSGDAPPKPGPRASAKGRNDVADPEDDDKRLRVIVFGDDKEYQKFGKAYLNGATEHSDGMFVPGLRALLLITSKDRKQPYRTLFHEAFHQFINEYIKNPPVWLNEGLAEYYEIAEPTATGLVWNKTPREWFDLMRKVIQFKAAIPLADITHATRAEFYDTAVEKIPGFGDSLVRRQLYYAESFTLIHMLLNDKTGVQRIQNYIRDLAKDDGRSTLQITDRYFDRKTCERLSPAWVKYINNRQRR